MRPAPSTCRMEIRSSRMLRRVERKVKGRDLSPCRCNLNVTQCQFRGDNSTGNVARLRIQCRLLVRCKRKVCHWLIKNFSCGTLCRHQAFGDGFNDLLVDFIDAEVPFDEHDAIWLAGCDFAVFLPDTFEKFASCSSSKRFSSLPVCAAVRSLRLRARARLESSEGRSSSVRSG